MSLPRQLNLGDVCPDASNGPLAALTAEDAVNPDLATELSCPICAGLFVNPTTVCSKGHTYCEDCVKPWADDRDKDCPTCRGPILRVSGKVGVKNLVAANAVDNLQFRCPDGCGKPLRKQEFGEHKKECREVLIECPMKSFGCKCDFKFKRKYLDEHLCEKQQFHQVDGFKAMAERLDAANKKAEKQAHAINFMQKSVTDIEFNQQTSLNTVHAQMSDISQTVGSLNAHMADMKNMLNAVSFLVDANASVTSITATSVNAISNSVSTSANAATATHGEQSKSSRKRKAVYCDATLAAANHTPLALVNAARLGVIEARRLMLGEVTPPPAAQRRKTSAVLAQKVVPGGRAEEGMSHADPIEDSSAGSAQADPPLPQLRQFPYQAIGGVRPPPEQIVYRAVGGVPPPPQQAEAADRFLHSLGMIQRPQLARGLAERARPPVREVRGRSARVVMEDDDTDDEDVEVAAAQLEDAPHPPVRSSISPGYSPTSPLLHPTSPHPPVRSPNSPSYSPTTPPGWEDEEDD